MGNLQLNVQRRGATVRDTVASGDFTPADAGEISKLIETYMNASETAELAVRLERLEKDVDEMIARILEMRIVKTGSQPAAA